MRDIDALKEENRRLHHAVRLMLLKIQYLIIGLPVVIFSLLWGVASAIGNWEDPIFFVGVGMALGAVLVCLLSIAIIRFTVGYYKEELGIKNLKTLDYERDEEIFGKISPEEIERESRRYYNLQYLLRIPPFAGYFIVYTFFMRTHSYLAWCFILMYAVITGSYYIYLGITEKFYLVKAFRPEAKSNEVKIKT